MINLKKGEKMKEKLNTMHAKETVGEVVICNGKETDFDVYVLNPNLAKEEVYALCIEHLLRTNDFLLRPKGSH